MIHTEAVRLLLSEAEIRESMAGDHNKRIASELRASAAYLRNSVGMIGLPVKGEVS